MSSPQCQKQATNPTAYYDDEDDLGAGYTPDIPPEMLANVFSYLDHEGAFAASHTCRFWRAVALSCPSLWADICVRLQADGSNVARADAAVRALLARAGTAPVSFRLSVPGWRAGLSVPPGPADSMDIGGLLANVGQLRQLHLDLVDASFLSGWDDLVSNPPSRLHELSLRFSWNSYFRVRNGPLFARSMPFLRVLDVSGDFHIDDHTWPLLPALERLSLRFSDEMDLPAIGTHVLTACPALKALLLVGLGAQVIGHYLQNTEVPRKLRRSISSLVIRMRLTGVARLSLLLRNLKYDHANHVVLHDTTKSRQRPVLPYLVHFCPTELTMYRPREHELGERSNPNHYPVARFRNSSGESRTFIVCQQPGILLFDPACRSITRLMLDESDIHLASLPADLPLLRTLECLTIRVLEGRTLPTSIFLPADEQGALHLRAGHDPGTWHCCALVHLALVYVPREAERVVGGSPATFITCHSVLALLDLVGAPPTVDLSLQHVDLLPSPNDEHYSILMDRVSRLDVHCGYEPLDIEVEWPSWRLSEDEELENWVAPWS
ncbi:hypothetical protein AURDEDRAFT_130833 [Auricularia subglabra TFB-10046 SS5]|uniref:F-box domain-containing protein n=1 Tax=Auricularia subglabra (strain TFB-10046 / SS5) TaxID=717982 RepID=J0D7G7_AURST|nr:hypothetical protein AURDEDRAFT_130833 [Auricularia subglabra TFB-10046 SS5]